jgi:hypothetical protein
LGVWAYKPGQVGIKDGEKFPLRSFRAGILLPEGTSPCAGHNDGAGRYCRKNKFSAVSFTSSIIRLAIAPAGIDGINIAASLAIGDTGIVLGIAGLAAGHQGVGRCLQVLLREVDCVIMDSGNERPGNS